MRNSRQLPLRNGPGSTPRGLRPPDRLAWRIGAPALAALALALGASVALAQPSDLERWLRLEAEGFTLYSNAEPEVGLRVALGLEAFRAVFGRLAPELDLDSVAPTVVFAFRDAASYAPYRHAGGPGGQVIGQFSSHPHGNAILLEAGGERLDALPVIYHEAAHELVRLNFPSAPLWFHEGLAEYYSTLGIGEEALEVGAPVERHLAWLRRDQELDLAGLVRLPGTAAALAETEHVGRAYAVSWALVHHLLSGGEEGPQRLADFLIALHEGEAPEVAFDLAFPQGIPALEEALHETVAAGGFAPSKIPVGSVGGLRTASPCAAAPADVLAQLGLLLVRVKRPAEAERHFDSALGYDDRHPSALVGLAHLRAEEGQLEEAAARFGEALAAGALGAEEWLLYGRFLLAVAERARARGRSEAFETAIEDARLAFGAAAEAFPGFLEARALLGASYLYAGDPQRGIDELVRARRRAPTRPDLAYHLALLYVRAEELDRAERLIAERLDPLAHAELYRQAIEALERARLLTAVEAALADGDPERGFGLLEQAIGATTDPDLRRQLEAYYRQLRERHGGS